MPRESMRMFQVNGTLVVAEWEMWPPPAVGGLLTMYVPTEGVNPHDVHGQLYDHLSRSSPPNTVKQDRKVRQGFTTVTIDGMTVGYVVDILRAACKHVHELAPLDIRQMIRA